MKRHHHLIIANPEEVQFSHQVLQLQSQIYCCQVTFIHVLLRTHIEQLKNIILPKSTV